jgi:ribosome recycling factor
MQQAIEHLQHELAGVRTGRANPGLIENILVDAHGEHLPVKACGTVTVRNPQLLAVTLYDAAVSYSGESGGWCGACNVCVGRAVVV